MHTRLMTAAILLLAISTGILPTSSAAAELPELPANQWVRVAQSKTGGRGWAGIVYSPGAGGMLYAGEPNSWNVKTKLYTAAVLPSKSANWQDYKPLVAESLTKPDERFEGSNYDWGPLPYLVADDGRKAPDLARLDWGNQACYDPSRKVIVVFARGETVELDDATRRWTLLEVENSPEAVYAGSLAYDPVNQEVVLANGGFSVEGCPRMTWVYRGEEKKWVALELGGQQINAVRLPAEALRQRLDELRWLVWKKLEFRATGRADRLDQRASAAVLAAVADELSGEAARLAKLAQNSAAQVDWQDPQRKAYESSQLTSAAQRLAVAAEHLKGLDAAIDEAAPEKLEQAYRGKIVPACEAIRDATTTLRVMPGPRMNAKLVTDTKNQVIVCFGGDGQDRAWGDTWVYHCDGRWWQRRHPAVHPPRGRAMTAAYHAPSGLIVHVVRGQTWAYDAAQDEWSHLEIPGLGDDAPAPTFMDYEPVAGCLIGIHASTRHTGSPLATLALKLDASTAKRHDAKPQPEVALLPIDGEFVLRDAASLAELTEFKHQTDQWLKSLPDNTWVQAPQHGSGRANWGRSWSSIVHDPSRRQLYYRDGGHGSYHGSVTDHYDLPTGRWFRSARREEPPVPHGTYFAWGRAFSRAPFCTHSYKYTLFYNPLVERLQRVHVLAPRRYDDAKKGVPLHDYDPDTGRWSAEFHYLPTVSLGAFTAIVVPGTSQSLLVLDNFSRYGEKSGQAWHITSEGVKQFQDLGVLPRTWDVHAFCYIYDPQRKRVMYYGGKDQAAHQLWALDISEQQPRWRNLNVKVAGEGELPLSSREIVYIPRHDRFLMLGGSKPEGGELAVWSLDPNEHLFRKVELASELKEPLRDMFVSQGLQYDQASDLCFYIQKKGNGVPALHAFRYVPQ